MKDARPTCPLCKRAETTFVCQGGRASGERPFYHCSNCQLTFTPEQFLPSQEEEKARYLTHNNDPNDDGYINFLQRLSNEIITTVPKGSHGLDYGSGPNPVLAELLKKEGYKIDIYDPFFANTTQHLMQEYDFVACCETAEHFFNPDKEFQKLDSLLKPGGLLAIMTETAPDINNFPKWHYHNDITHVVFYNEQTMGWIANQYGWECKFPKKNVTLFLKPPL